MLLDRHDLALFFRLHRTLMFYVNQRLNVVADSLAAPEEFACLPPEARLKVRDALLAHMDLIDAFTSENPADLPEDELDIVRSWQHLVAGKFYAFRELKKHTVFLSSTDPVTAYGVLALSQPFEELIGPYLPVMTQTVLLPFKGKIVYDGLISRFSISFGSGIKRMLSESFTQAKQRQGIVTSLPIPATAKTPTKAPKTKSRLETSPKEASAAALATITGLIDQFCHEHLNDEYASVCRKLAEKLARKRPSPLIHGSPNAWASGIVRAVGGANFLHDKSQTPYLRASDIDHYLGTSTSAGAAKVAAIRKLLRIHHFDHEWTLPSRMDDNPLIWMLNVNGFMMDIRRAPREVQQVAFEKGLIPYIPADRP